ncbi:MAG: Hsp20/alpha crystallin family protein [Dehalococcoidia bacterium]|nr:Hsp20/alpha crystallin family protein [Dehalococcoidia bacterium]
MERWRPRSLLTWNPVEEMERLLEDPFLSQWPLLRVGWGRTPRHEMAWAPALEMYEKDNNYVVKAELPGVKKDDIDVSITGDKLTIKGQKRASKEIRDEDYYRCESQYGSFLRTITLPAAVDAKKIEASYEDGILEIRVPKAKEAVPTKVEIKVK